MLGSQFGRIDDVREMRNTVALDFKASTNNDYLEIKFNNRNQVDDKIV